MHPNDHINNFQLKLKRVRRLLSRQISLSNAGVLPQTELEAIYELAFFNVFVAFENDLTELFKTNLLMEFGTDGKKRSIFLPKNRSLAAKLLVGTKNYFQLLPVDQMEKTARVYFKDGGPFTSLTAAQKQSISRASVVRNHIAHRSRESKELYIKKVLSHATLAKSSSSPGYYLNSNLSISVTYFDHHVSEIGAVLKHFCLSS